MNWSAKWEVFVKTIQIERFKTDVQRGLINTIKVAILGLIIGILIGSVIAIIKVSPKNKATTFLGKICDVYVAVFRGTPMVVQLLLTYYVLIPMMGISGVEALNVGIIIFGMNSGAYVAEIMRGGINAVDKGQMEAGRAVGLGYTSTMMKIVVPQAIKNILPTLGNEFITLIKETSVLSFITVTDLYTAFNNIGAKNYEKMVPFIAMAVIYIIMVLIITVLVKLTEYYFAKSSRKSNTTRKKATEDGK